MDFFRKQFSRDEMADQKSVGFSPCGKQYPGKTTCTQRHKQAFGHQEYIAPRSK